MRGGDTMAEAYIYSPFNEILGQFNDFLEQVFSQISELQEKRKISKSADAFIDLIMDESVKKNIANTITNDILKSMPEGIWNVETIGLVESKLKLIFDNDFMTRLKNDPQFNINDPEQKSYFLKVLLSKTVNMQIYGITFMRNQIIKASIYEKDMINIRLGREITETLDLINEKSKKILLEMKKTKELTGETFSEQVKKFWTAYTLLFLRIVDLVLSYHKNREETVKKMNYLSVERVRIGSYY